MTAITLEAVQAKQTELAAMIEQLQRLAKPRPLVVEEATVDLCDGEHYAGAVLNGDGTVKHHLVLMAEKPDSKLSWQAAKDWAASVGGSLPDRQEQALLFANCKQHMQPEWHWSSQEHESDASCAWNCYFGDGGQGTGHKSWAGCARAVRRV
jgi:hypothetical protein